MNHDHYMGIRSDPDHCLDCCDERDAAKDAKIEHLEKVIQLMRDDMADSGAKKDDQIRVLRDALEFYHEGNEWDYGVKAKEALAPEGREKIK